MFMKARNFKVQDGIILGSSTPEANEQSIAFCLKKSTVISQRGFTQETENILMFLLYVECFHFPYLRFEFKRSFLHSLLLNVVPRNH